MRLLAALAVLVAPVAAIAAMDRGPISPPTFRLGDDAAPVRYDVRLAIDPRATTFEGEVAIELRFARATGMLWLNATELDISKASVVQDGRELPVEVVAGGADFVGLKGRFEAGAATARFAYRGRIDELAVEGVFRQREEGDWYVFTQFQAVAARRAFPCFDEPAWKTPWRLAIDAPATEVVVANTPEESVADVAGRPGWRRHTFAQSKPLPSYLVAFAVGPFDVVDGGVAGANRTRLRYIAPKGRGGETRYAAEVTPKLLGKLEEYFGIPYPFEKLDSIAIPQLVTFGAMENVGLISYGSTLMLADRHEETARFRESFASLAAHEVAHMWFGNLATLAWWNDTWLNESFASWVGSKVMYDLEPAWDNGVQAGKSRHTALAADRLAASRAIATPVEDRNAIDDAFDDITYNKGEEVLAMFEAWIGPERFQRAVRAFLRTHAYGTARSDDFFRAVGDATGEADLVLRAFRGFVQQPGAPLIDVKLDCGAKPALEVRQARLRPKGSTMAPLEWTTPACFRIGDSVQCDQVDARSDRLALRQASCPAWIVGNARGRGHYLVRYDAALLRGILAHAAKLPQHEAQALAGDTLLLVESGLAPAADGLRVANAVLGHRSPNVRLSGIELLEGLRDEWLTPALREEKGRIVARRVMPLARELGWLPRAGDGDEVRALRFSLVRFAADRPEGASLRAEARTLAMRWLADAGAVDAEMARAAVQVAGRFADAATFDRLERAALSGRSTRERFLLLAALARVRDTRLRLRALELALAASEGKPRLDGRSAFYLVNAALFDDESRGAALDYAAANLDALESKMPRDTPAALLIPMGRACTRGQRDTVAAAFGPRAARYVTGPLRYAQALESIDLCVAAHAPATLATNSRAR